ncbi:EAL and HDOD domain-containing protein [uncultured Oscillibacter sp.]|uniref:EAL and HDOD domain-containing protein n=1 Tax=uncultured Oscillibacter sp. TaxID=876091 RepID=UPI0025DBCA7A|nr:HDOD domain-containing protein [uncultured Oscillibacter sp.]
MSSKYIVRQPIKDPEGKILGQEILYYGENQAFSVENPQAKEFASADTIYSFLTQNSTTTLKGSLNFMTFTTMLLMKKTPRLFDKSELVIQINDSVIIHPLSMHFVNQFAKEGYKIAVNEFQFAPRYLALLDSIDYIKVNIQTTPEPAMHNIIEVAHSMHKKCVLTNIETDAEYRKALMLKADGLEGPYVAEQMTTRVHSSAYLQSSFFRLMVAITRDEPNVDEIEQLISMDASLSYNLLKVANSAYFATRNRAVTVHQAIMTLGLAQLKQWIYLLSASVSSEAPSDAGTEEFLKRSFMRASFCKELMKYAKNMPVSQAEAYLMGMFSTLNHLVDAPLEEILDELPISDMVKDALVKKEGRCGKLYELVLSYEAANWNAITTLAEELGIPNQILTNVYFNCMENVNVLWEQLSSTAAGVDPANTSTAPEGAPEAKV